MTYQITGHTRLGCLLGTPVAHSISPMMYNESFRLLGIDHVYLCFDTKDADLKTMVQTLKEMNVFGFNLTMPDKERIIPYLDELSPAAQMIGAVNTVKNENGRLIGHNTDGIGYMRSVRDTGYDVTSGSMTLLGAGGAASSIAIQAALDGVPELHIVNRRGRSWENALRLADTINSGTSCRADVTDMADTAAVTARIRESRLLTNATSIGMAPNTDASPITDLSCFHPDLLVSDIIYNPRRTKLLLEAEAAGCQITNGMYMLLYQGSAAFRIWTGQEMPVDDIRAKFFS
jgi:shikimate dehydrogenase